MYATGHVSLHDRPHHFVRRKAINLCVQHANQSEKSRLQPKCSSQQQTFERAQESHENSPKSLVESNLRSVHNSLGQNNETVKKQISLIFYSLQEPLDNILYLHYYYKQIHVNVCDRYVIVHDNLHDINIVAYLGLLNFIFVMYFYS